MINNKKNNIFIFDWDDTLFPTTEFISSINNNNNNNNDCKEKRSEMIGLLIEKLISTSLLTGKIIIVTNAQTGWIEHCLKNYLPTLKSLFDQHIEIIYAKHVYDDDDDKHNNNCCTQDHLTHCKFLAFVNILLRYQHPETKLIFAGDSMAEFNAAEQVVKQFTIKNAHIIQFTNKPSYNTYLTQLHYLVKSIPYLVQLEMSTVTCFRTPKIN